MEENLEVFFCDICNTSVPARDLEIGAAARVKGRTIGVCCLPALRKDEAPRPAGMRSISVPLVILAAVAGATVFLDWRLTEEMATLDEDVGSIERNLGDQQRNLLGLEERLDSTALRVDVVSIHDVLSSLETGVNDGEGRLSTALSDHRQGLDSLGEEIAGLQRAQEDSRSAVTRLAEELRGLAQSVAELKAAPRSTPEVSRTTPNPPASSAVAAAAGLPAELRHQLSRLTDEDPGTRFEAVDELVRSKNPMVREHLLPMVKDPDMFVRRLTLEGLREFRHASCVDALLVSLADEVPIVADTAYDSLKALTGQEFPFDPDSSRDVRASAQRRWEDWWEKARDTF